MLPKRMKDATVMRKIARPIEHSIIPIIAKVLLPVFLSLTEIMPKISPIIAEITEGINVQQHITEKCPMQGK